MAFTRNFKFQTNMKCLLEEVECADHIDNDGDGLIDDDDPGCSSQRDRSERQSSGTPECNNGRDDDGDGRVDWPLDIGCEARGDSSETNPAEGEMFSVCGTLLAAMRFPFK